MSRISQNRRVATLRTLPVALSTHIVYALATPRCTGFHGLLIGSTPEQTSHTTTTPLEHSLSIVAWLSPSYLPHLTLLSLVICKITRVSTV